MSSAVAHTIGQHYTPAAAAVGVATHPPTTNITASTNVPVPKNVALPVLCKSTNTNTPPPMISTSISRPQRAPKTAPMTPTNNRIGHTMDATVAGPPTPANKTPVLPKRHSPVNNRPAGARGPLPDPNSAKTKYLLAKQQAVIAKGSGITTTTTASTTTNIGAFIQNLHAQKQSTTTKNIPIQSQVTTRSSRNRTPSSH